MILLMLANLVIVLMVVILVNLVILVPVFFGSQSDQRSSEV